MYIHVLYFYCMWFVLIDTGCSRLPDLYYYVLLYIETISLSSQASNHTIQPFLLQFSDEEHLEDLKQGKPSTLKFRSPEEWKLRKLLPPMWWKSCIQILWHGSVTHLLKEGTCYTAIHGMFTSLVTYHNLTLTLHSYLMQIIDSKEASTCFLGALHQSSEMTEDIGLGRSWFVFFESRMQYSKQLEGDLISGNSRFLGEGAVISRLE